MDKLAITKKIISTIVGIGTTKIVSGIIENNVDTDTTFQKVTVASASTALGYAVSEYTSEFTDSKIDELAAWWNKNVTNRKTTSE